MDKKITGTMVYYLYVCERKLWYFYNEIKMEQDNEDVAIGKLIDENTYKNEKKHIKIDNIINIDFLEKDGVLHEVKKSKKIEKASLLQVKYYLYYLKTRGVDISGKLDYPLIKQSVNVELDDNAIIEVENALEKINQIIDMKIPPKFQKKSICKKCAYCDLCLI